jgi:probable phosphoglycerate mutase
MGKALYPNKIFSSPLKRTMETADIIRKEMGLSIDIVKAHEFIEIDHGPDENKTEDEVTLRLGKRYAIESNKNEKDESTLRQYGSDIIKLWDEKGIVPYDWIVDVMSIKSSWKNLADNLIEGDIALVVTSSGIIRFAPYILAEPYESFCNNNSIKVSTGGICIFENENNTDWNLSAWNVK